MYNIYLYQSLNLNLIMLEKKFFLCRLIFFFHTYNFFNFIGFVINCLHTILYNILLTMVSPTFLIVLLMFNFCTTFF